MIATDPLLQILRVGSAGQHVGVVIKLQQQRVETTECLHDVARDVPGVGEDSETLAVIDLVKNKLQGFPGIVRNRYRQNFDIADGNRMTGNQPPIFESGSEHRACGANGSPQRDRIVCAESLYAAAVITVFMCQQNRIDAARVDFESIQPLPEAAQRKAVIDQNRGVPVLNQGSVTLTATPQ